MKTICKFTGMELYSSSGFSRWALAAEHPIFDAPLPDLIELAAINWSPSMPELEKKLLLLAIGRQCELIKWATKLDEAAPAMPSLSIIESSIHDLLKIAGWIDFERHCNKEKLYPTYHISTATCYMQTFPDMLHAILQNRHLTDAAERKEHRLKCLENAATNLSAKCRVGNSRKEGALLRVTAEWALTVCSTELKRERVTYETQQDWLKMLQTSPSKLKASNFSITDVEELREFMLDYLPHGSVIAHDVIAHLNALVSCNVVTDIDQGDILKARVFVDAAMNSGQEDSSMDNLIEPVKSAFPDLLSYVRAKAAWQLKKLQAERAADVSLQRSQRQLGDEEI